MLGAAESLTSESFETGLLEYPQFTKPRDWQARTIPDILLSGDHKKIEAWRRDQSEQLTAAGGPICYTRVAKSARSACHQTFAFA